MENDESEYQEASAGPSTIQPVQYSSDKAVIDNLDGSPVSLVKLKPKIVGFACKDCEDYYRSKNLTEDQLKIALNICSQAHQHLSN